MDKLTGKFLVAAPNMKDPAFEGTVVFIAGNGAEQGSIGMVINRSAQVSMLEVYRQLGIEDAQGDDLEHTMIGWGGPVQATHGYILHSPDAGQKWDVTIYKDKRIAVTVSPDIVFACARGQGPQNFQIVLGCAAWVPGQLEEELANQAWLVAPADPNVIFSLPLEERYNAALALVGLDDAQSSQVGNAFSHLTQAGHA